MRVPNLGEVELLVPLHEGVFELPMWRTFLERLRQAAGVAWAAIAVRPTGRGEVAAFVSAALGDPPRFAEIPATAQMREGRVYGLGELAALAGNAAPGFTLGDARAVRLSEEGGLEAWLALADQAPLGPDAARLLGALAPHLRAAIRVLGALERERTRASVGADAFSRLNFGWVSLDARCRIVDLDPQAERFLRQSGLLRRGPYDRLTPSAPQVDRHLTALVRRFAEDRKARPEAMAVSRDPWVDVLVAPVRMDTLAGDSPAVAVVYLRGDRTSSADRHEQLVDLFALTPSEARLAWAMAQGQSIADAAAAQGLTVETARNYSKKIYAKTGASGQVDLVRHILTGVLALA